VYVPDGSDTVQPGGVKHRGLVLDTASGPSVCTANHPLHTLQLRVLSVRDPPTIWVNLPTSWQQGPCALWRVATHALSTSDTPKELAKGNKNILVKALRFVSLVCAVLALGLTLAHDLEIPGKHSLDGPEWRLTCNIPSMAGSPLWPE
jgi:hypothetical protein